MEIKHDRMVLGQAEEIGRHRRPDADRRSRPRRRTNVFVGGRAEPIVASRTEQSILAEDMGASESGFQTQALREAITELLGAFHELSPVERRALLHEHHFDIDRWEQRLGEILRAPQTTEAVAQNELFD